MNEEAYENLTSVVLAGIRIEETEEEFDHAMEELESLAEACDLWVSGIVTQILSRPDPATWMGSGKAEELSDLVRGTESEYVVCLGNLSPTQMKNLQRITGAAVWDRTNLILEIFSRRARTHEARLQVESAYLQFMLPRLSGMWQHLGRQGGGGGSRANKGVGEKQIELDRRQISHRISELRKELSRLERTRDVQRSGRLRGTLSSVALVGYTNAGKSSLMNALLERSSAAPERSEDKKVFEKDMLFATLDTSIRKIALPGRRPFLLSDTVGFIENIPHGLIKAFRSTLSEIRYADILLIVIDSSDPHRKMHKKVTEDTLRDLDALTIPRIYVYSKADLRSEGLPITNKAGDDTVYISSKTGYGIDDLLDLIEETLQSGSRSIDVVIPYSQGALLDLLHREAVILSEDYTAEGTHVTANCSAALADHIFPF